MDHKKTKASLRHTLRFVTLTTAIGVVVSGMAWLVVYDLTYAPVLDFEDAPRWLALTLIIGWLLSGLVGLTVYAWGNASRKMLQAMAIVIFCGLVVGIGTGHIIINYGWSHYSTFCERLPGMC